MTKPSKELIEDIQSIDGDVLILGVGGKMGPTLAKLAKRAIDEAGIETIAGDLLDNAALQALPDVKEYLFLWQEISLEPLDWERSPSFNFTSRRTRALRSYL